MNQKKINVVELRYNNFVYISFKLNNNYLYMYILNIDLFNF